MSTAAKKEYNVKRDRNGAYGYNSAIQASKDKAVNRIKDVKIKIATKKFRVLPELFLIV